MSENRDQENRTGRNAHSSAKSPVSQRPAPKLEKIMFERTIAMLLAASVATGCTSSERPSRTTSANSPEITGVEATDSERTLKVPNGGSFVTETAASIERNDEFRAAHSVYREAVRSVRVAESARRTQMTVQGIAGAVREDGGNFISGISGEIAATRLLYDGGAVAANIERSRSVVDTAEAELYIAANQAALDASTAWLNLQITRRRLDNVTGSRARVDALLQQLARIQSGGLIDMASIETARLASMEAELEQQRLRSELLLAEEAFRFHYSDFSGGLNGIRPLVAKLEAELNDARFDIAPSIKRARAELEIGELSAIAARAKLKPTIGLRAAISPKAGGDEFGDANIGVSVAYTVGDGGRRRAEISAVEERVSALGSLLAAEEKRMARKLSDAKSAISSAQAEIRLLTEVKNVTEARRDAMERQMVGGQATLAQIIAAERSIYSAEDDLLRAQGELWQNILSMSALLGLLAPSFISIEPEH